jgi:hypothetical protein
LLQVASLFTLLSSCAAATARINPPSLATTHMAMLTGGLLGLLGLVSLGLGISAVAAGGGPTIAAVPRLITREGLSVYRLRDLWAITDQQQRPPVPWLSACGYLVVSHFRSVQLLELQETAASLRRTPP